MSVSTVLARRGLLMLVVAGVLWGTGGLLGQLLAESSGLSPLGVAAVRLAAGGGLILAYLRVTGRALPRSRAAWLRIGATGLLAATFQASYFTAVTLTSVSLATLITIGAAPVIVLIARYRTASRSQVVGTALALLGLAMLIGLPTAAPASGALLAGAACALLAGAGFAMMTLLGSRPVAGLDDVTTVGVGFTVGGLMLASIVSGTSGWSFVFDLHSVSAAAGFGDHPDRSRVHLLLPRVAEHLGRYRIGVGTTRALHCDRRWRRYCLASGLAPLG